MHKLAIVIYTRVILLILEIKSKVNIVEVHVHVNFIYRSFITHVMLYTND